MDNGRLTTPVACWTLILLSIVLTFARLLHAEPLNSANDRSRWCTVRSLVELDSDRPGGPYEIGEARQVPGWDTIDLVKHEGHFYSSKPPLLATIVAGLYWAERQTVGWTFGSDLERATRLILLVLNLVPMAIALVLLIRLIREACTSAFTSIYVTTAAAFGTLLLPFLTVLNNHTVAATAVVFALYPLVRILQGHDAGWRYGLVGFWAAFACCNELPAAAFGVAAFGLVCWRSPQRALLWFAPAALVPLAAFFYTNYLATGGWKPFYAYYGTDKYKFVHEGIPSYWMNPKGIDANRDNFATYLLHCTIGHHGLLSLSPVFLFTLFGWTLLKPKGSEDRAETDQETRDVRDALRPVHWTGLSLTLIVFAYFMTRTQNYNYGGVSVALRWMLWLTPFWLLAMIPALDRMGSLRQSAGRLALQSFAWLALAVSTFSAWYPLDGPWKQPWLFTLLEQAGWINYRDPPPELERDVRTWISQLPDGDEIQSDYWIELEARKIDGSVSILRIEDLGPAEIDDQSVRMIRFSSEERGEDEWVQEVAVSVAAFEAGLSPAEFILRPEGTPVPEVRERAKTLLSGMPGAPYYIPIQERYLKVPLRTDAFHTLRAYAQLLIQPEGESDPVRCRREIWINDEVPFGIVQMLDQVTDSDGVVISRETFAAVRAGTISE